MKFKGSNLGQKTQKVNKEKEKVEKGQKKEKEKEEKHSKNNGSLVQQVDDEWRKSILMHRFANYSNSALTTKNIRRLQTKG